MGKPESTDSYEEFSVENIRIYILKSILLEYVKKNVLIINIEGYGRFRFNIIQDEI